MLILPAVLRPRLSPSLAPGILIKALPIYPSANQSARLLPSSLRLALRTMSTSNVKHLFLVYAPDKTDEGALERRLSVRPEHLKNAKALHDSAILSCVSRPVPSYVARCPCSLASSPRIFLADRAQ